MDSNETTNQFDPQIELFSAFRAPFSGGSSTLHLDSVSAMSACACTACTACAACSACGGYLVPNPVD